VLDPAYPKQTASLVSILINHDDAQMAWTAALRGEFNRSL
jgi:hypothetical protein